MDLIQLVVTWLVVTSSLLLVAQIPFVGVEVDSYKQGFVAAIAFGLLNALLLPILKLFFAIPNLLTLGLLSSVFAFVANVVIFSVAAALIPGFRLRRGIVSAVLGAIALSVVTALANSFVYGIV